MKLWFWVDLLASFPYSWILDGFLGIEGIVEIKSRNVSKTP